MAAEVGEVTPTDRVGIGEKAGSVVALEFDYANRRVMERISRRISCRGW